MKRLARRSVRKPLVLSPRRPLGAPAAVAAAHAQGTTRPPVRPPVEGRPTKAQTKAGLPRFARIAFMIVFAYLIIGFVVQEFEVLRLSRMEQQLEDQAGALEAENKRLAEEIAYAQTPEYIERIAREELGLVWPNEIPYAPGRRPTQNSGGSDGGSGGP